MGSTIWISHRGHCRHATENTAEAFRDAAALGFDHLETDLRVSRDGHLVLLHDPDLKRLGSAPYRVEQLDRQALEKIELNGGERLVFFDQLLAEFADEKWVFDIKPETATAAIDALQGWWQQPHYSRFFDERVRFLLWHPGHQSYLLNRQPQAVCMAQLRQCRRAGLACAAGLPKLAKLQPGMTYALPPRFNGMPVMHRRVVQRYQSRGARVLAYLPKTERDTLRSIAAGADEVLTNGLPLTT